MSMGTNTEEGTEELTVSQLSSPQEKNEMFVSLNIPTRCPTSKAGDSKQHVMIRLKSQRNTLWNGEAVLDILEKAERLMTTCVQRIPQMLHQI